MSKPTLGYWNYRGYGNPIRFLCAYIGLDYEEKRYVIGNPPEHSWEKWLEDKFNLGLDFPNVPYWIEGDLKLTQVKAILKHIARSRAPTLLPPSNNLKLQAEADVIDSVLLDDILVPLASLCYGFSESALKSYTADNERHWTEFSNFLGTKKWILGNEICYLDFLVYEVLYYCKAYIPALFAKFPNFGSYLTRFEEIPSIKAYLKSPRHVNEPCFSPSAKRPGEIQF